jgi:hypothetical protein
VGRTALRQGYCYWRMNKLGFVIQQQQLAGMCCTVLGCRKGSSRGGSLPQHLPLQVPRSLQLPHHMCSDLPRTKLKLADWLRLQLCNAMAHGTQCVRMHTTPTCFTCWQWRITAAWAAAGSNRLDAVLLHDIICV